MKSWRESASIILAARNGQKYQTSQAKYDYDILFLKRKQTSKFSGAYVFPGGVVETADADTKWKNLYKNHGLNENSFVTLLRPCVKDRPRIFKSDRERDELPREISLRITAIRETFEECGILLCQCSSVTSDKARQFPVSSSDQSFWQNAVHRDPNEFYNMCEKLNCVPNLWALHEWANWLTPTFYPPEQRFDTAFFFACLPRISRFKLDRSEMDELLWTTPIHVKESLLNYLPPPQLYEINLIAEHEKLDDLIEYALKKSTNGAKFYFSIKVKLHDGVAFLFPGDSMYPKSVNLHRNEIIDMTNLSIKEFNDASAVVHRLEIPVGSEKRLRIGDSRSIFSKL